MNPEIVSFNSVRHRHVFTHILLITEITEIR